MNSRVDQVPSPPVGASAPRALSRVLVTGGAGFLGSHLCERLIEQGCEVICVDDLSTGTSTNLAVLSGHDRFTMVVQDVCEPITVSGHLDAVLHLASPASPQDYLAMPIQTLRAGSVGTLNYLDLARAKDARFVLASTSEVYGDPLVHPQTEDYLGNVNCVGPRAVYDEAKRFSEAATAAYRREYDLDTGIVRIFNTYGPRLRPGDGRVVSNFIAQAIRAEPLTVYGDGRQTRSFCYVDDLLKGILAMTSSPLPGPVNLGNPAEVEIGQLAQLVLEITASTSSVSYRELPEDDPQKRRPDITLAKTALGFEPSTALIQGLELTARWMKAVSPH